MAQLLDLTAYRTKVIEQKAFGAWRKRFNESYGANTKVADLSDKSLYFLAKPGEETAVAFYELIMGILGLGKAVKFYYLDDKNQMMVMDIHLFLADQVRFELMRRLGWLTSFPGENYTLLEMVQDFAKIKAKSKQKPPVLSESHPEYNAYDKLTRADKQVFIRRKLGKALEEFCARLAT
ncbi:MAG: hypothetical protein JRI58_01520 [Deltaproteobacteria bacterium]|nr:hypothetical protein [Deltaproteobacteria bacterium]MBW2073419.1 hypothetical protein [Deltaproteobacteria bacterium]RLB83975.1 MAG: hypothetical protein DRH17_00400 [Deltaproteobacteria bacterium]